MSGHFQMIFVVEQKGEKVNRPPKNIISYKCGTAFMGKEIKDWINYHIHHDTSHTRQARQLVRFLTINDNEQYVITKGTCMGSLGEYLFIVERREDERTD